MRAHATGTDAREKAASHQFFLCAPTASVEPKHGKKKTKVLVRNNGSDSLRPLEFEVVRRQYSNCGDVSVYTVLTSRELHMFSAPITSKIPHSCAAKLVPRQ